MTAMGHRTKVQWFNVRY